MGTSRSRLKGMAQKNRRAAAVLRTRAAEELRAGNLRASRRYQEAADRAAGRAQGR